MKRVTSEQLERLAFTHPGTSIEVDAEQGISLLVANGTTYYASLDNEVPC